MHRCSSVAWTPQAVWARLLTGAASTTGTSKGGASTTGTSRGGASTSATWTALTWSSAWLSPSSTARWSVRSTQKRLARSTPRRLATSTGRWTVRCSAKSWAKVTGTDRDRRHHRSTRGAERDAVSGRCRKVRLKVGPRRGGLSAGRGASRHHRATRRQLEPERQGDDGQNDDDAPQGGQARSRPPRFAMGRITPGAAIHPKLRPHSVADAGPRPCGDRNC